MKRSLALTVLCLLVPWLPLHGRQFEPWDAGAAAADGPVDAHAPADADAIRAERGIYDSFTGGALLLIRAFQIWISPLDGPSCRFHPTCSAYGKIAVRKYGAFIGSILAGDRILRCNLFSRPGEDPVPDNLFGKDK